MIRGRPASGHRRPVRLAATAAAAASLVLSGAVALSAPASAAQPRPRVDVTPQGGQFYSGPLAAGSTVIVTASNMPLAADPAVHNIRIAYCGYTIAFRTFGPVLKACSTEVGSVKTAAVTVDNGTGETFDVGNVSVDLTVTNTFTTDGITVDCRIDTCGFATSSIAPVTPDPAAARGAYVTLGVVPTMTATLADGSPLPAAGLPYTSGFTKIKVTGHNFRPGSSMRLIECDLVTGATNCFAPTPTSNGYAETSETDASGTWTAELGVANGKDGSFDCFASSTNCGLLTSRYEAGADRGQEASLPLAFTRLAASKTTSLTYNGETVAVTGNRFAPGAKLNMTVCNMHAAPPAGCDMDLGHIAQVTVAPDGTFSTPLKVRGEFGAPGPLTRCTAAGVTCAIAVSNAIDHTDRSQDSMLAIGFADKPAAKAPSKPKLKAAKVRANGVVVLRWSKATAHGMPVTKYVVKVKKGKKAWKKAGATKPPTKKLVWKKGKPGKYKAKVIARSAAGSSESRTVKFKIKR